ncbi:MAG: DUF971 domain-containing protein [Actinomycetota bacterium]|nr:DUF971 domain-containing protein [Actinomycetota bacterium]
MSAGAFPAAIDIQRDHGVTITWDDGHLSRFDLEDLRINCPCAQCRDLRQDAKQVWPRPGAPTPLRIESARQVGNWGLNVAWNDGHTTGIYTWTMLRSWCPYEEWEGDGSE